MKLIKILILIIGLIFSYNCQNKTDIQASLYKITYTHETNTTNKPTYFLSFKSYPYNVYNFNIYDTNFSFRIKFDRPPQNELMGTLYYKPVVNGDLTTFEFFDTNLVGFDSMSIREKFMKDINHNTINIYLNDSIIQSIKINKEPFFDYFVGTDKELEERKTRN